MIINMNTLLNYLNYNISGLKLEQNYTIRPLKDEEIKIFNENSVINIDELKTGFISGSLCLKLLYNTDNDDIDLYDNTNNLHKILTKDVIQQYKYNLHIITYVPKDEKKKSLQHIKVNVVTPDDMAVIMETYDFDICKNFIDLKNKMFYIYKNLSEKEVKYYDVFENDNRLEKYKLKFPDYKFTEVMFSDIPLKKYDLCGITPIKGYAGNAKKIKTKKIELKDNECKYTDNGIVVNFCIDSLHKLDAQQLHDYIYNLLSKLLMKENDKFKIINFGFKKLLFNDYKENCEKYENYIIIKTTIYDKYVTMFENVENFIKYYENAMNEKKNISFYEVIQKNNISPFIDIDIDKKNLPEQFNENKYLETIKLVILKYYECSNININVTSCESLSKLSYHIYVKGISNDINSIKKDIECIASGVRFENKLYDTAWIDTINYAPFRLFRLPFSVKEKDKDPEYPRILKPLNYNNNMADFVIKNLTKLKINTKDIKNDSNKKSSRKKLSKRREVQQYE